MADTEYRRLLRAAKEKSGVSGKFQAHLSARVMPGLQRVLEILQGINGGAVQTMPNAGGKEDEQPATMQEFIRKMFAPSRALAVSQSDAGGRNVPVNDASPVSGNPLVAQLDLFQRMASKGEQIGQDASDQARLTALRDQMPLDKASVMERLTIDLVAMLFEFILEDDHVPLALRRIICRLQIPVLKAAILDPTLMSDERHPARQLLNRLSTAAVAVDPMTRTGGRLATEIERAVCKVLAEFDRDTVVFSDNLAVFETFLADYLQRDDSYTTRGIEAIEDAERFSLLLVNATNALCGMMKRLNVDKRVSDFIIQIWPHVLVHAVWQDRENDIPPDAPRSLYRQYHALLPELLWSIQEKDAQELAALVRLLPDLVKRMRKALELIQLPEDETKPLLDLMVEMHTQVLRPTLKSKTALPDLDALRQELSRLVVDWESASWGLREPPQVCETLLNKIFAKADVAAELNLGVNAGTSTPADREFLVQTYRLGTRVAFRLADGSNVAGQLVWVSTHRSLYLFRQDRNGSLVLYTPAALLEALREETIVPVEYAPVFERAVESLLYGAGTMQNAA